MRSEYEAAISEGENTLKEANLHLPLGWIIEFILDYAETGEIAPEELQNLARQIHSTVRETLGSPYVPIHVYMTMLA